MLAFIWVILTRVFFRAPDELRIDPGVLNEERDQLGPLTYEEGVVFAVFASTALLWVFRKPLVLGLFTGDRNLKPGQTHALFFQNDNDIDGRTSGDPHQDQLHRAGTAGTVAAVQDNRRSLTCPCYEL